MRRPAWRAWTCRARCCGPTRIFCRCWAARWNRCRACLLPAWCRPGTRRAPAPAFSACWPARQTTMWPSASATGSTASGCCRCCALLPGWRPRPAHQRTCCVCCRTPAPCRPHAAPWCAAKRGCDWRLKAVAAPSGTTTWCSGAPRFPAAWRACCTTRARSWRAIWTGAHAWTHRTARAPPARCASPWCRASPLPSISGCSALTAAGAGSWRRASATWTRAARPSGLPVC